MSRCVSCGRISSNPPPIWVTIVYPLKKGVEGKSAATNRRKRGREYVGQEYPEMKKNGYEVNSMILMAVIFFLKKEAIQRVITVTVMR